MHLPFQYGKTRNFCGISDHLNQKFVVIGAPIDCATTFRSGTRMGPNSVRDASMMLTDGTHERYPVDFSKMAGIVGDFGDIPLPSGYHEAAMSVIENRFSDLLEKNMHPITIGGHHGITLPILRSFASKHGMRHVAVVHFDAHCDTWCDHFGMPGGHGTWLHDAIEDGLIDPTHTISIGIRSPADEISRKKLQDHGGTTISARSSMRHSAAFMSELIRSKIGDRPCYMTLDIDCLDPAYAPGTGTPEIGGLSTIWMSELLESLETINWIGMDCVEVCPAYDHSSITSLAAATFIWQYLSMVIHTDRRDKG